ncbi:DUF192 domain-containing protein [Sediminibacillus massiliensis]|uniref:DUF192 domain-containing protein n=1 Tax=Sediminibacillus massiliensis TaxID=1926277 RepID=UPI001FEC8242|nr:DUF192 domain-containing protein [Sediminibacillus massiliensis]
MRLKLINDLTKEVIAEDVKEAYRFWPRFKGLMLTKSMPDNAALHLAPCSSIHTFFMKYSIDILYLNKQNEVVGIEENLEPGKIGKRFPKVHSVIELPAGRAKSTSITVGHTVTIVDATKQTEIQQNFI